MIINFKEAVGEEHKCSFCQTTKSKAKSMIKSTINDKYICDKCISHCTKLVEKYSDGPLV